jgi:hypothetical protein
MVPYNGYGGPINGSDVNALNSETLERGFNDAWGTAFPMTMSGVVSNYGGKTGFLVWEIDDWKYQYPVSLGTNRLATRYCRTGYSVPRNDLSGRPPLAGERNPSAYR